MVDQKDLPGVGIEHDNVGHQVRIGRGGLRGAEEARTGADPLDRPGAMLRFAPVAGGDRFHDREYC
ncbi:MAG: hypothetical protein U0174_15560 [Polyangiaceae bacterium]